MPKIQKKKGLTCTFCGKHQDNAGKLIAGPGVYICDECVDVCFKDGSGRPQNDSEASVAPGPKCSFCGQRPPSSKSYSQGVVTICFSCIDICNEILFPADSPDARPRLTEELVSGRPRLPGSLDTRLKCSFCGKSQGQVKKLIAGPGVYICNECCLVCQEILRDEGAEFQPGTSAAFCGQVATGDPATFKKDDFVVCRVEAEEGLQYKAVILSTGPQATLRSRSKLSQGTMRIARYVGQEQDKIVIVDYEPS